MAKNLMGRSRRIGDQAYITLVDPRSGWRYEVLKTWQADGSKPYGRAFCDVYGFAHEAGDVYVDDLRGADIVAYDRDVFQDENAAAAALFGQGAIA